MFRAKGSSSSQLKHSFGLGLGVVATAWTAIVAVASVPWFLDILGIENYGLIGFFATMQVAIGLLDLGLGATINREVARSAVLDNLDTARRLLSSLEVVYFGVAFLIFVCAATGSSFIGTRWLGPSTLDRDEINNAIKLMGLVAALRWPTSLYLGTLVGLQRMTISYCMTATMATVANVGAVLVLLYVDQKVTTYFLWHAAVALIYLLWARRSARRELGQLTRPRIDGTLLLGILKQSILMSGVAISGLILTQLDRFILISSSTLEEFGRYSLAVIMTSGLAVVIVPTFNLIYPRLSGLVAAGDTVAQVRFYRLGTRLFLSWLFPIALSAFFYAAEVLTVWTGNRILALETAPIASLLCLGAALNGMMHFPYAIQLASGRTRLPLFTNCSLMAIMIPLAIYLVNEFGVLGGALSVLCLNGIYVIIGVTVTHVYLLPGLHKKWIVLDVVPALLVASITVSAGFCLSSYLSLDHVRSIMVGAAFSLMATGILIFLYRDVRIVVKKLLRSIIYQIY